MRKILFIALFLLLTICYSQDNKILKGTPFIGGSLSYLRIDHNYNRSVDESTLKIVNAPLIETFVAYQTRYYRTALCTNFFLFSDLRLNGNTLFFLNENLSHKYFFGPFISVGIAHSMLTTDDHSLGMNGYGIAFYTGKAYLSVYKYFNYYDYHRSLYSKRISIVIVSIGLSFEVKRL